ncbi:ribosomal protein S16 [Ramicandelaber brevisporus]|nr:ribosomal protein S16 [Ramicandelaber brevisporus]
MQVRLRLQRYGLTNAPVFHIVAANLKTRRNSKPLELLGKFAPVTNEHGNQLIELNFDRTRYWLGHGASPSKPVLELLASAGIVPPRPDLSKGPKKTPKWHKFTQQE